MEQQSAVQALPARLVAEPPPEKPESTPQAKQRQPLKDRDSIEEQATNA
jgi:hypothetical protein